MSDESYLDSWQLSLHDKADSTRRLYRETLAQFARWLPEGRSLLGVTRRDCQAYLAAMKADGRAQATIRSRWIALRSFYAWAAVEEEIAENPMLAVKVEGAEPPPPDMPDDGDLKLLLKVCAGKGIWERRDLAMIRVAAATGVRVGELCALEVGDVGLMTRVVVIRKGKGGRSRVARIDPETAATVDQFGMAKRDILGDPATDAQGDIQAAHLWAPILQTVGPGRLQDAQNALDYGEQIVARWLRLHAQGSTGVGCGRRAILQRAGTHKSHGRRIDRDEARSHDVVVEDLEDPQELQDVVLTAYHVLTLIFEQSLASKVILSTVPAQWVKSWAPPGEQLAQLRQQARTRPAPPRRDPNAPPRPRKRSGRR